MKNLKALVTAAAVVIAVLTAAALTAEPENFPEPPAYPEGVAGEETVPPPAIDTMVVEAVKGPEGLSALTEGLAVVLKWNTKENAASYDIYRSDRPEEGYEKINKEPVRTNSYTDNSFFSISPPKHAVKNFYRVTFTDPDGRESEDSETIAAVPVGPLMPPGNLKVSTTVSSASLSWEAPESKIGRASCRERV